MNIGEASRTSGVPAKLIRYYERIGLIRPAGRTQSNYRHFTDADAADLSLIRKARVLGFSVAQISELLSLGRDEARPPRETRRIAEGYLGDLETRIAQMQALADSLRRLL